MGDRKCTKCKLIKPISEYYKDKHLSTGFHPWCKQCKSIQVKKRYTSDIEKSRGKSREAYRRNIEVIRKRSKKYAMNNKAKIRKKSNEIERRRMASDPVFAKGKTIKRLIRLVITGKSNYTPKSLVYKVTGLIQQDLVNHLHSTFELNYGMPRDWINLKDVEIDHIIPLSTAQTVDDVKRLNHYSNLQLLFKEDNQAKGTKIPLDNPADIVYSLLEV